MDEEIIFMARLRQDGNSLVITLPAKEIRELKITKGSLIKATIKKAKR